MKSLICLTAMALAVAPLHAAEAAAPAAQAAAPVLNPEVPAPARKPKAPTEAELAPGTPLSVYLKYASIIAKEVRDGLMRGLADAYPGYGWERNMGYGTAQHLAGICALGVTPHHRQSFAPVKNAKSEN